jgi:Response regulator of the LytR/AlgR family
MKTVIIDDEPQIIDGLTILLKNSNLTLVGRATNFKDAVALINAKKPELVFLDIKLHSRSGFEVLGAVEALNFNLIFITAYNEYAIKAFKYNAFDYLLKPIDPEELQTTLNRLQTTPTITTDTVNQLNNNKALDHIVIRTTENVYNILTTNIVYCKADQGYTHFYLKDGKHILSSKTLKEYVNMLPTAQFIRVHQSYLVNWPFVTCYNKKGVLILQNTIEIPVSTRKRKAILNKLS